MARWASIPVNALGAVKSRNQKLLDILHTNSELLESLQGDFLAMIREKGAHMHVACFYEELPLPFVGLVVSKDSATFEGYHPISIHADHRNMVRFTSPDETGFKRLVGELIRLQSKACA